MSSLVPSLIFKENTELIKCRELPVKGNVLVQVGDEVSSQQIIAEAEMLGDLLVVKLVEQSGLDLDIILKNLMVSEGQLVQRGQLLLNYKTFFGLFETSVSCPIDGTVEFISQQNAHVGIRGPAKKLILRAYLAGKISSITDNQSIEIISRSTYLQGIFGVGGERFGQIQILHPEIGTKLLATDIPKVARDQVLVSIAPPSSEALEAIVKSGASGLIVGSIDNHVLTNYLGYELGLPITGSEELPFTLIISEGFGEALMSDRLFQILSRLAGAEVAINGATQIRAGAVRPEIIIANTPLKFRREQKSIGLEVGTEVKVVRYPYFGLKGRILHLPVTPELIETGAMVRVAEIELEDRRVITVPRANLEIL